jgi:hypothetical protein
MSRTSLEDTNFELIKSHVLDPEHSPIPEEQKDLLDRVITAAKILDKHPVQKQAAAILRTKYPHIGLTRAYYDLRLAARLFNSFHTFDYDFWHSWLINDIIKSIEHCRNSKSESSDKTIAMEHANLLKAIGTKPIDLPDPLRNEKHQFNIIIQANGSETKLNLRNLKNISETTFQEINKAIYGGSEITDVEAIEIMKT